MQLIDLAIDIHALLFRVLVHKAGGHVGAELLHVRGAAGDLCEVRERTTEPALRDRGDFRFCDDGLYHVGERGLSRDEEHEATVRNDILESRHRFSIRFEGGVQVEDLHAVAVMEHVGTHAGVRVVLGAPKENTGLDHGSEGGFGRRIDDRRGCYFWFRHEG